MTRVPLRRVWLGELAWRAKQIVDCFLGFTGRRWEP